MANKQMDGGFILQYCFNKVNIQVVIPRSKITGRFRQESTGNRWNVEAVFPPEIFPMISDRFLPESTGN
jgi:hypothetical protein